MKHVKIPASRSGVSGITLVALILGVGSFFGFFVVVVVLWNTSLSRQATALQHSLAAHQVTRSIIHQAGWMIGERTASPLTSVTLRDLMEDLAESHPQWTITLEDESAKLNIHSMAFALPYALSTVAGLPLPQSAVLVTALADAQGMSIAQTRGTGGQPPVAYPWRPPAAYTLSVEPGLPPQPFHHPDNRHLIWGNFGSLPPWRPLESPEDLLILMEGEGAVTGALSTLIPHLTTSPTLGLNINTCDQEGLLSAVLAWQRDAPLGHPRYTQAYDALIYNVPPTMEELNDYLIDPPARPYYNLTRRVYTAAGLTLPALQTAPSLLAPQFRQIRIPAAPPIPAAILRGILDGRPYTNSETLQMVAVHSFLFPFSHEWLNFSGPVTEAAHFQLKGPGPFAAESGGYFRVVFTDGPTRITTILKIRSQRPPKILRWDIE